MDELSDDLPLAVDVITDDDDDLELAIVKHEGSYFAIHNECSHAKVPLSDGDVIDCTIECYLHGSLFDLRTGEALNLPATQPVPVYPCRVVGTDLEVDPDTPITTDPRTQKA